MHDSFHNRIQNGYDELFLFHMLLHVVASIVGMLDPRLLGGSGFFIAMTNFSETIILALKLSALDTFIDIFIRHTVFRSRLIIFWFILVIFWLRLFIFCLGHIVTSWFRHIAL
ncbi:hypothetical protein ACJ41O_004783 [Fusarium nematophilum]